MLEKEFQPKQFYRKFDALLARIEESTSTRDLFFFVLDELVQSFQMDLSIRSGCIYSLKFGRFKLIKGPVGDTGNSWPEAITKDDPVFKVLDEHKSYIFSEGPPPPWGLGSIATYLGEQDEFLLVFRLSGEWVRETLQFSMNTIRSTLNLTRSTNRFSEALQEASEIQRSLLPEDDPVFEGYDISGRSIQAESVGGDLYDYNLLDEGVLCFAIGDASGHGLPAALLARDVVTGLRMGVENEMKISAVMGKLNRVINQSRLSTRFVSLVYGEMERNGTLVYVNAGHPAPMLFKGNSLVRLGTGGTILGPIEDTVFHRGFAFIDPGDILVMFSDGILEVRGGDDDMFGEERLIDVVKRNRSKLSAEINDEIFRAIREFGKAEHLQDDATVVVIRRID
ncbi:MAG TPA: PP2C family protein-serine/threonine phosphatase [Candidatus Krumholzibacterium sp.]|nr:PP2C family protein-serine/threonine phosphatase [Candidatus Krumholzibacterium sp.]